MERSGTGTGGVAAKVYAVDPNCLTLGVSRATAHLLVATIADVVVVLLLKTIPNMGRTKGEVGLVRRVPQVVGRSTYKALTVTAVYQVVAERTVVGNGVAHNRGTGTAL